jgi:hypothetical protein
LRAFAPVQLDALAGDLTEAGQDEGGGVDEWVARARGEFAQSGARAPQTVRVAREESVDLEAHREPVCGGARETGPVAQFGEAARLFGHCM